MSISGDIEALEDGLRQIQQWCNINQDIKTLLTAALNPLFSAAGWVGQTAQVFEGQVVQAVTQKLDNSLQGLDWFAQVIQGTIQVIIDILQVIDALVGWL